MGHYLIRHLGPNGACWVVNGHHLPAGVGLSTLLQLRLDAMRGLLDASRGDAAVDGAPLPPIEHDQEVWASGVTYLRSREARMVESETKDIYDKVYTAERVEVFFKAIGWRVMGPGQPVRVRGDSAWNVPEPELTLVLNRFGDVVGYTAGNDMSSRDIEGENPLYLPQAKVYDGSCALGPGIVLADAASLRGIPITMRIERGGECVFEGETSTDQLKRTPEEMAGWLTRELSIPHGAFLMTGTGIVPPDDFSLAGGDRVMVRVGDLVLENPVAS